MFINSAIEHVECSAVLILLTATGFQFPLHLEAIV